MEDESKKCPTKNCEQKLEKMNESKIMFRGVPRLMVMYYCPKCRTFISTPELVVTKQEVKEFKKHNTRKA